MNYRQKNAIAFSIVLQILLIRWISNYPEFIETYYSNGIYPYIGNALRWLYGVLPFSLGDVLYTLLSLFAIRYIYLRRLHIRSRPFSFIRNLLVVVSIAYFSFHLLWGLNYYRQPIYQTLELKKDYTVEELQAFTSLLVEETNKLQLELTGNDTLQVAIPYSHQEIFFKVVEGYERLSLVYPKLNYKNPSVKGSLYSLFLTYMGYGGYLNPFTLEAQVNTRIPNFRFPVVSCHEIAHQLGFAAENEANFIGYLAALNNEDPVIKYTALSYALSYCLFELRNQDETEFQMAYAAVHAGVRKDFEELNRFWTAYENPLEPVFKEVYNTFLLANNQTQGIRSYNLVVALLVAYHQAYPL